MFESWSLLDYWWLPLVAVILDFILGDPAWLPHPVRLIGRALNLLEPAFRRMPRPVLAGTLAVIAVCGLAGAIACLLTSIPHGIGTFLAVYLSWSGLALGGLRSEGKKALAAISSGDITEARRAVSMLVSRDVEEMDKNDLCRSLAETLSENLNDAFVAPFFWLLLFGPVGLWVYKAASTMDSMWGYKTGKWLHLGKAAARFDDILAYIPARLTAFSLYLSAIAAGTAQNWPGWARVIEQARLMSSPNAGLPMAVAAWLHKAPMGGPTKYDGAWVEKPRLGPAGGSWTADKIHGLIFHIAHSGLSAACVMWAVGVVLCFWMQ